jgi:hypothetical protein
MLLFSECMIFWDTRTLGLTQVWVTPFIPNMLTRLAVQFLL